MILPRDWIPRVVAVVWEGAERNQVSRIEGTEVDAPAALPLLECLEWESTVSRQTESEAELLPVWPANGGDAVTGGDDDEMTVGGAVGS